MPLPPRTGIYISTAFGLFCILSAGPFIGIPPNAYYTGPRGKNAWLSDLTGGRISATQAGYLGAGMRIAIGAGLLSRRYSRATALGLAGVIVPGTYLAWRDGRPMLPQVGMLAAIAAVVLTG